MTLDDGMRYCSQYLFQPAHALNNGATPLSFSCKGENTACSFLQRHLGVDETKGFVHF